MHIPDGWLSFQVSIITWIVTLIVISISLYKLKDTDDNKIVYMGIIAAIVFE
ncbi:MAG: energy-coupling factor ABC transporter permease, partial [Candidatus Hodarchaeales archaeon]